MHSAAETLAANLLTSALFDSMTCTFLYSGTHKPSEIPLGDHICRRERMREREWLEASSPSYVRRAVVLRILGRSLKRKGLY